MTAGPFEDVLDTASVLLIAGTGGVGKTTVAASIGAAAAARGRRVVVLTIDPAKRLANALGIDRIGNEPVPIDAAGPGELWATMLDAKATFDGLITTHAAEESQAARILDNRIYRNLSGVLSGTQEYMASERLLQLDVDERFDLVVVDTPPSRNALDFLDAPDRLARFLDGRVVRLLFPTTMRRAVTGTLQVLLRRVAVVVGTEIVDDTVAFLQAFAGMEEGFRERARRVRSLLADPGTGFVIVTAPTFEAGDEAGVLIERLHDRELGIRGFVVNRAHPSFAVPRPAAGATKHAGSPLGAAYRAAADAEMMTAAEAEEIDAVMAPLGDVPVVLLPLLDEDVHDLEGIAVLAGLLEP